MSVSCGSREFIISSLVSSKEIVRCSEIWRARSSGFVEHRRLLYTSQISVARKWMTSEGNLRLRRHEAQVSVWLRNQRQRKNIYSARSSRDSDSVTEDAEKNNPGKPKIAGDSVDSPEASSFRRDSGAEFDGCIAEFLPPSERKVLFSQLP